MMINTPYEKYQESSVFTASPEELTLMLYNGLVKFILQALFALDKKDMEMAHASIVKAKKILINFQNTLDMKYEVSKGMMIVYEYMYKRLTDANIKKDKKILEEMLGFAKDMRDTWSQAMKIARSQRGPLRGIK